MVVLFNFWKAGAWCEYYDEEVVVYKKMKVRWASI
jgi:hypothetical protein